MKEDDLPTRADIFNYWKDKFSELGVFIDWGEPSCWACKFHYDAKYDIKRGNVPWEQILECWNSVPLQRCHIIPRSLGGTDTVDNLFLLCRECHDLAPNTIYSEIFIEWVKHQRWQERETLRIEQAMNSFEFTKNERERITNLFQDRPFRDWMRGKTGLHWPQSRYASKSFRMTPSTIIGLAKYYMRNEKYKVSEEFKEKVVGINL